MRMIQLKFQEWTAEIAAEYGMNTVRLVWNGEEIIRSPESEEPLRQSQRAYGMPLLLPPNRTADGSFVFGGKEYQLPVNDRMKQNHIHGFISQASFTITEQTENHVIGTYQNKGELYPFPFCIEVCYWLDEEGYHQKFQICNTGTENMPLTFGLHTNFVEKDFFAIPIARKHEVDERYIPTGKKLPLSEREVQYRQGTGMGQDSVNDFFTSCGHVARMGHMEYVVSENFDQWVLYNGGGDKGFISMEPQCGAVNCLNSREGLLCLEPGKTEVFDTLIRRI